MNDRLRNGPEVYAIKDAAWRSFWVGLVYGTIFSTIFFMLAAVAFFAFFV